MIANTAVYCDGHPLQVDVDPDDLAGLRAAVSAGKPGSFVSVGIHEPDADEMAGVAKTFGLHRLAVEDAVHPVQRPKLEKYGDMTFLVLKTLSYVEKSKTVACGQVAVFMGADYVLTVRQDRTFDLEDVRQSLESQADVLEQGPAAAVYAVCDHVVDGYGDVITELEGDVDDVEDAVFSGRQTHASKRIYELNRELTTIRRAVHPLNEPLRQFAHGDVGGVSEVARPFFRDVGDHVNRIGDAVDSLDSLLSSVFDANLSRIGVQQNDDMRRMSAWAAIFAVVSVLAGIYGMNFVNMPELTWAFGYAWGIGLMVFLSLVLHRNFKRSGWL